ncbi:transcription factor 25, putative [Plasmodium relictum]|uniref:Transcription factor 25, putative n=1 Tax=Plasmodium relictum TaxID=85471 RepID=A0A1J1H6R0_PLARL|nr:transcription factor 25, putative [Plasmodium relictum]CRH00601.1 transcription factor 25, putative [Plasmodium relictum]
MSSRLLKKLLKEKNRDEINKISETVEPSPIKLKKKKNFFKYLEDSDTIENSSEENNNEKRSDGYERTDSLNKYNIPENINKNLKNNKNKKDIYEEKKNNKTNEENNIVKELLGDQEKIQTNKKSKKKKKKKNLDEEISSILNKINEEEKKEEKEKDKKKEEESSDAYNKPHHLQLFACTHEKYEYCLKLEKNNFDVNIELKRIFGKDFVKDKKYIQKSKIKYLKNWLIQDYTTKTIQPPLTMVFHNNEFKIEKSKLYLEADNLFYMLLDSHDIQSMNDLLKKYPFHVETLLVLSEYYNESSNYEVANKFIKMSLLLLQNIFHINFHPNFLNKNSKIFVNPFLYDNKSLYKSLYIHMISLENEACTITSLEIAKLLCKMDLYNDLCSILLRIDNIILKCNLFEFLVFFSFNFIIQNIECVIPSNRLKEIMQILLNEKPSDKNSSYKTDLKKNQDDDYNNNNNNNDINDKKSDEHYVEKVSENETIKKIVREVYENDQINEKNINNEISQEKVASSKCNVNKIKSMEYLKSKEENNDNIIDKINYSQKKALFHNFEIRLHFILPNFSFSIPLSLYLKNNTIIDYNEIKLINKDDVINSFSYEECKFLMSHFNINFNCYNLQSLQNKVENKNYSISFSAHLMLIRALLCYPHFLHIFLNYNNFKTTKVVKQTIYEISFKDILSSAPFSNNTLFNEEDDATIQKIISCYLEKNNIYYKSEKIITWFHVCSSFIHELYKNRAISEEIEKVRCEWSKKIALFDINKYKNVRIGEFKSTNYLLPDFIMEKNRAYSTNIPHTVSNYYVSLNSNLLIAFFQSLLPWYQVDYYGTRSRPVHFSSLLRTVIKKIKLLLNFE